MYLEWHLPHEDTSTVRLAITRQIRSLSLQHRFDYVTHTVGLRLYCELYPNSAYTVMALAWKHQPPYQVRSGQGSMYRNGKKTPPQDRRR
jgi:hypothetical protein